MPPIISSISTSPQDKEHLQTEKPPATDELPQESEEDYEEDSDDDINVIIGDIDIKTYCSASLNVKRHWQYVPQSKKFTVEESKNINNVPIKPWCKPGADITDYFNYGFNEDTFLSYCKSLKRMKVNESETGLLSLNAVGMSQVGPPLDKNMTGSIDVIGGAAPICKVEPPKEDFIQVITSDKREYSRKPRFPDMSVPPPTSNFEEFQPEFGFNPEPEPFYGGYEPTQDCQWGNAGPPDWHLQETTTLTPTSSSAVVPPLPSWIGHHHSMNMPPPSVDYFRPPAPSSIKKTFTSHRSKSKDREASVRRIRNRSRESKREKSHRYDRSHSRSHRHKSRSRSPMFSISIKESSRSHQSKNILREREREKTHRYDRSRSRSHRHKSRSRSRSHYSHRQKKF